MCCGEGGILPEAFENAYKYIFEYVPNQYSVTEANLKRAEAIEIKFGQPAKPGMGGHLPADKVTNFLKATNEEKNGNGLDRR
jgi:glutamate synthase domain-containing protein 2